MDSDKFPQGLADIDAAFMTAVLGVAVEKAEAIAGTEAVHLGQVCPHPMNKRSPSGYLG
jgi:hypothetical protein